jgi:hypothetical protein
MKTKLISDKEREYLEFIKKHLSGIKYEFEIDAILNELSSDFNNYRGNGLAYGKVLYELLDKIIILGECKEINSISKSIQEAITNNNNINMNNIDKLKQLISRENKRDLFFFSSFDIFIRCYSAFLTNEVDAAISRRMTKELFGVNDFLFYITRKYDVAELLSPFLEMELIKIRISRYENFYLITALGKTFYKIYKIGSSTL